MGFHIILQSGEGSWRSCFLQIVFMESPISIGHSILGKERLQQLRGLWTESYRFGTHGKIEERNVET